jgi:hypothetical protein
MIALLIMFSAMCPALIAQEAEKKEEVLGWSKSLVGAINLTQNRYSSNWTQGGENALAWKGVVETKWENNQRKTNWRNTGKLVYGQIKQGDDEVRKSDDEIKVESVLTYKAGKYLNPYFSFNGQTQITRGFLYTKTGEVTTKQAVSDFFDPAYLRQSLGLGYKPAENFTTRFGISVKETIADLHRVRYGNKPDQRVRVETGIESTTDFSQKIEENVLLKSKLELFTSFENLSTVDAIWDNTLTAKVSKYFAVNLNVHLFYDEDILSEVQVKQTLAFGFTYTFF